MPWTRDLSAPIELKDGRTLITLADASALMQSLPANRQRREHWLYAGGLLKEAASSGNSVGQAHGPLMRALRLEGLI
jgi:hypothetical protein